MASAPAGVDEVPVVGRQFDGVPRVVPLEGRWGSRLVAVAVAFPVAAHDYGFQAAVAREDGEEFCIPRADGKP